MFMNNKLSIVIIMNFIEVKNIKNKIKSMSTIALINLMDIMNKYFAFKHESSYSRQKKT